MHLFTELAAQPIYPIMRALRERNGHEPSRPAVSCAPDREAFAEAHSGRVLIVDDNRSNGEMLRRCLELRDYQAAIAVDGAGALALLSQQQFDLVLLDILMPGMSGWEVLQAIRARRTSLELPVIMATGQSDGEDVAEALHMGANDYVTKPFDLQVVTARIATQLALKRAADERTRLQQDLQRRNAELAEANLRMKRDLQSAARTQRALLPPAGLAVDGVGLAWEFQPCEELGGDILNIFPIGTDHLALYILDVSGHGVPAAMLAVTLSRLLAPAPYQTSLVERIEGLEREPVAPAQVAAELNERFPMNDETEQFFSLLYGVLDLTTWELHFVNAGHPGPMVLRGIGLLEQFKPDLPIGVAPEHVFQKHVLRLEEGDRVYFCSDGITEARNHGGELFGMERAARALIAQSAAPLKSGLDALIEAAQRWNGAALADDASAIALEARAPK